MRATDPHGPATTGTVKPGARAVKSDVRRGAALLTMLLVLITTVLIGLVIWAASTLDGGVPGVTAPAGDRDDTPRTPSAAAPVTPPTAADGRSEQAVAARLGPGNAADTAGSETGVAGFTPPLDCPGSGVEVKRVLPAPDGPVVVQAACRAGSGSPPDALFAYDTTGTGAPRLIATLLSDDEGLLLTDLERDGGTVTAAALGWSSAEVPRCCPDVETDRTWTVPGTGD